MYIIIMHIHHAIIWGRLPIMHIMDLGIIVPHHWSCHNRQMSAMQVDVEYVSPWQAGLV